MAQIHKKFTEDQVKDFIERYLQKKIERKYIEKNMIKELKVEKNLIQDKNLLLKFKSQQCCPRRNL